jgi:hypothetical protein
MSWIGMEFQPGTDRPMRRRLNSSLTGPLTHEALQILSLRLPAVLAGRPISPGELLRTRVGGEVPQSAVVQSALRSGGTPTSSPGASGSPEWRRFVDLVASGLAGSTPAPHISPRGEDVPPEQMNVPEPRLPSFQPSPSPSSSDSVRAPRFPSPRMPLYDGTLV